MVLQGLPFTGIMGTRIGCRVRILASIVSGHALIRVFRHADRALSRTRPSRVRQLRSTTQGCLYRHDHWRRILWLRVNIPPFHGSGFSSLQRLEGSLCLGALRGVRGGFHRSIIHISSACYNGALGHGDKHGPQYWDAFLFC